MYFHLHTQTYTCSIVAGAAITVHHKKHVIRVANIKCLGVIHTYIHNILIKNKVHKSSLNEKNM